MGTVRISWDDPAAQFVGVGSAFPRPYLADGTNYPRTGLAFGPTAKESAKVGFIARSYGSGVFTLGIWWWTAATSGVVRFTANVSAITPNSDTTNVETDALDAESVFDDTCLGSTKQLHYCEITINTTELDSLAADDEVTIVLSRDAANGADTINSDDVIVDKVELSYSDT